MPIPKDVIDREIAKYYEYLKKNKPTTKILNKLMLQEVPDAAKSKSYHVPPSYVKLLGGPSDGSTISSPTDSFPLYGGSYIKLSSCVMVWVKEGSNLDEAVNEYFPQLASKR